MARPDGNRVATQDVVTPRHRLYRRPGAGCRRSIVHLAGASRAEQPYPEQQAVATSLLLGLGLGALGGCMVPLEILSATIRTLAHATPHAWRWTVSPS